MLKLIKELFNIFSSRQRSRFLRLQILVLLMTLIEMCGVVSISPFMALIGDMSLLDQDGVLRKVYLSTGVSTAKEFIFLLGVFTLVILTISSLLSMYTVWSMALFANKVGTEIGEKLYRNYMSEPWLFHTEENSAHLTKKISIESARLTQMILVPLMQLNARVVLVVMMSSMIFWLNPAVAVSALTIFGIAYFLLFKFVRRKLAINSMQVSTANEERFVLMAEGFGGIKDVLLLGRQKDFIEKFNSSSAKLAYCQGSNQGLVEAPRHFMELVTFSALILLILYLYSGDDSGIGSILPLLSVYALAGFKMLPAFQQIYRSVGRIKGNISAFDSIKKDLLGKNILPERDIDAYLVPKRNFALKNVSFTYPGKDNPVLNHINISISVKQTIGLVGSSGSGKSTLIDLLMGLIEPSEGGLLIDGRSLTVQDKGAWQNTIGYVPQSIFLSDRSFLENIAFGVPLADTDIKKAMKAATLAHLEELLDELPEGIHSHIGERGIQLSGGQRQRIGIARALYHDPEILIFDEATSALDGLTEKAIMDAIHDFSGKKTIVMIAHRLKTVRKCDVIFYMDKGRIVDKGTFTELLERNETFRDMADHS